MNSILRLLFRLSFSKFIDQVQNKFFVPQIPLLFDNEISIGILEGFIVFPQ